MGIAKSELSSERQSNMVLLQKIEEMSGESLNSQAQIQQHKETNTSLTTSLHDCEARLATTAAGLELAQSNLLNLQARYNILDLENMRHKSDIATYRQHAQTLELSVKHTTQQHAEMEAQLDSANAELHEAKQRSDQCEKAAVSMKA